MKSPTVGHYLDLEIFCGLDCPDCLKKSEDYAKLVKICVNWNDQKKNTPKLET